MKLKTFVDILRGGNLALGTKLSSLLTEDCTILEYTNDSVLFSKGSKLVLAKFKHPLTESRMTSDHIVDNEVIELSKMDLTESMKASLNKVIECVISENLVEGQVALDEFCQTFYQVSIIKNKYPEVFIEERIKNNKGVAVRREAKALIPAFKAEIFNNSVITESNDSDEALASLITIIESSLGLVLTLGKTKVTEIVTDALLGNSFLSESITKNLYTIAEDMDSSSPLGSLKDNDYDLDAGKFGDEDASDLEHEDEIPSVPTEKENLSDEDESSEFEPFNPAMFSEDDIKQLHKTTLKAILSSMSEFIKDKASDSSDEQVDPDLGEQVDADLASLDDPELGDDRLSEIEARYNPIIDYFLDSSYHTPADELSDMEDQPVEDQIGEEEATSSENVEAPPPAPEAPAMPPAPEAPAMPPVV